MKIQILEAESRSEVDAEIEKAELKDMPIKKNGWQFTWRSLYKTEGAEFFKLSLIETTSGVEGMLMLSLMNDEMLYITKPNRLHAFSFELLILNCFPMGCHP